MVTQRQESVLISNAVANIPDLSYGNCIFRHGLNGSIKMDIMDITEERLIDAELESPAEKIIDCSIRPKKLADYIGQTAVREQMQIFMQAAIKRAESLDHTLIFGPPGLGKTTMAHIIAHEMGVNLKQTSGPTLEKAGDLVGLLTSLEPNDVLFIDEIHRLSPTIEEFLYPAMEDGRIDIMIGEGPAARSVRVDIKPFTLVGATTRAGLLSAPLRDRFGITQRLEFYKCDELTQIILRSAKILNTTIDSNGAKSIAERSRGTPRIANRLLRRVRDFAQVQFDGHITAAIAKSALDLLHVDQCGFDVMDRKYLTTLIQTFGGGPAGVDSLAAAIAEERDTIEEVIEPYLIQEGFVKRTARGRQVTDLAYQHLNIKIAKTEQ